MNEFLEQFLIESRELVEQATQDLLALEQTPDDDGPLDSAFRAFHTLKGAAGIVEFAAMGRAVHAAEDVLAEARAGDFPITAELIGDCLTCLDQILQWLETMEASGGPPADAEQAADRLVGRFNARSASADTTPTLTPEDHRAWIEPLLASPSAGSARTAIRYTPAADSFFKDEDPLALMAALPGLLALNVAPRQPWPSLDVFDPFACNLVIDALSVGLAAEIADHLHQVRDQVVIHALPDHRQRDGERLPDRATEILSAQLALLSEPAGDAVAGRLGSAARVIHNVLLHLGRNAEAAEIEARLAEALPTSDPEVLIAAVRALLEAQPLPAERHADEQPRVAPADAEIIARSLRVEVERIDAVVNLAGELMVVKNAIGHSARRAGLDGGTDLASALKDQHARLHRLTEELLRSVLAIRVLPLGHIFRRFPRLVREMATSLGKASRLVIVGESTEADKAVVEALFEPLLHVIRNAVDHGVEAPDQRAAAGKPDNATIRLSGWREGEHIIVEVVDDGRGIDPRELRQTAAQRGFANADALASMADDEVVNLIFAPGFSTAAAVTHVSGRGVGMDALRSSVERLGGRVTIHSRPTQGTTVRFTLPFTVMTTGLMTVESGGQAFGIPFEAVVETVRLPRDEISRLGAARAFVMRGRTIPLVVLAEALGLDRGPTDATVANTVVVDLGGQLGALEVDRIGERLDVMLKPMDGLLAGMRGIAGTTLLGDGQVLIVLDLQELLE